jgi:tripartite-type tricarboxylate transporter receptor subunit TctC
MSLAAYPDRPLRFVIPYASHGPGDRMARQVGTALAGRLGQPVHFENVPGKGASIGTALVAQAPADGYTLLLMASPHTINPSLYRDLPYDSLRDFQGVTQMISMPNVLVVDRDFPADTVGALVAHARAHPGQLKYASSGTGTPSHLGAEMLKAMAGLDIGHVQYEGHAQAGEALRKGEVHMLFDAMLMALPEVRAGKVKALGVTSASRSRLVPDIPSIHESGVPGFDFSPGVGVLVRSGTPKDIITRLQAEIRDILRSPAVSAELASLGAEIVASTPEAFDHHLALEVERWAGVCRAAGIFGVNAVQA